MTKDEAMALAESGFWKEMSYEERAWFQLHEELLCMPFSVFHEAVEKTLKRPVFTHEFAGMESLQRELRGERPAPTFEEVLNLIPADKRMIVVAADRARKG